MGVPFAIVAMPSIGLAVLGSLLFGIYALLIALPAPVYWVLTKRSGERESALQGRYQYGRSPDLAAG